MNQRFGYKLRKLREATGITQTELSRRIGYANNSYLSDVESGRFVPPEDKLRDIARALDVGFGVIKEMAIEARLEGFGIQEPDAVRLFKDFPRLNRKDKSAIIKAYLEVKEKQKQGKDGPHHQ